MLKVSRLSLHLMMVGLFVFVICLRLKCAQFILVYFWLDCCFWSPELHKCLFILSYYDCFRTVITRKYLAILDGLLFKRTSHTFKTWLLNFSNYKCKVTATHSSCIFAVVCPRWHMCDSLKTWLGWMSIVPMFSKTCRTLYNYMQTVCACMRVCSHTRVCVCVSACMHAYIYGWISIVLC